MHTALVYYVFPGLVLSLITFLVYHVLSTPLGWFIFPVLAGLAAWLRYGTDRTDKKIKNGERYFYPIAGTTQ